ncbi:MAG TPA: metal-sensitive transcriptional regulator [Acidimicrobiia bacterium]|nr:metal-sensitive transcriptional regulator [Acidimicrobiia bacterium]
MVQLNDDSVHDISKRLRRAHGQLAGVIRMLEEGQDCQKVLMQLSAVNKAVSRAGYATLASGLTQCYESKEGLTEQDKKYLEKLFLSLA